MAVTFCTILQKDFIFHINTGIRSIFNSTNDEKIEEKDLEMFEETNLEEDFEIPAFLRRQKN